MDDMIGIPEREEARVIPISAHPGYTDHTAPEICIEGDEYYEEDGVDYAMMEILEETVGPVLAEQNAIGNNVCWQCSHRQDIRPLWKRLFRDADETSFECKASSRIGAVDPVTGQTKYVERIQNAMGIILALVDRPHRRCVDVNPSGRCEKFDIEMVKNH